MSVRGAGPYGGDLEARLASIRTSIADAAARSARSSDEVILVAISKRVPADRVAAAAALGVGDFGENYVKELTGKREVVGGVTWHFIGTLQSNTAHRVAETADWVDTLVPGRATERLAKRAAVHGRRIPCLIQVDFTDGARIGTPPEEVEAFCDQVAGLEGVELRGLMTLPPMPATSEDARPWFVQLRELRNRVAEAHPQATELSMGMSLDYGVAVEEGATMVRVGTALFGERPVTRTP
ncbi:MAG: YggS family pyridoxal phosphate-dependent enzyme [Actinomycetota bacterium]